MNRNLVFRLPPLALALALAACTTVGPDYRVPATAAVNAPKAAQRFEQADAHADIASQAALPDHWWRLYDDATLDRLIEQALARNTDLRQAVANLERVQAIEDETAGARRPTVSASGGPSFGHASGLSVLQPGYEPPDSYHYSANASLSYQVDPFGQIRRAMQAAVAGTGAAWAALDLVRVNVAAGTAQAYADVCAAGLQLRTAQHSLEVQRDALNVTRRLQQAGRAGELDVSRAQAQLSQLDAMLPPLKAQRQAALYRLATLTGDLPRDVPADAAACAQPPKLMATIPVGDGAALLRRRPDIRQAERELAQATARIGVATADLYPKVSLGLSAGSIGPASDIGRADTFSWSLGPLISWTLPNTGAAQARIAQAEASTRAAAAKFDGTVLTALRETETALSAYAQDLDRRTALQAARQASATAAEQARLLYRNGKTGYLESLDAERGLASSDAALAAAQAQLASDQIAVFRALGGGWEAANPSQ